MQVSFNTVKPYTQGVTNKNFNNNNKINFKSGYGAEEFTPLDNDNLSVSSESERWKNILDGLKMILGKQYEGPKKKNYLFTEEERNKLKREFYEIPKPKVEKNNKNDETYRNYEED